MIKWGIEEIKTTPNLRASIMPSGRALPNVCSDGRRASSLPSRLRATPGVTFTISNDNSFSSSPDTPNEIIRAQQLVSVVDAALRVSREREQDEQFVGSSTSSNDHQRHVPPRQ